MTGGARRGCRGAVKVAGTAGFSLAELVVALGLSAVGLGAMALMTTGVLGTFAAEPAAAEQQQRARAVAAVLTDDLARAGSGFLAGADQGPGWGAPAVVPDRLRAGAWVIGATPSTLGVIGGARSAAHARLAAAVAAGESRLVLERPGYCAPASPTCRFAAGDDIVLSGAHGAFALATIRAASPPLILDLTAPLAEAWPAGTTVSVIEAPVYALRDDPDTGFRQVVRAQGPGPATALVDFVDRFDVEWLVAGPPPVVRDAPDGAPEHATFGPLPPPAGQLGDAAWPAGENCLFRRDAAGRAVSRLAPLGTGAVPVPVSALADGPWCPSPSAAVRWDADLSRVVGVRLRIDLVVASAALRAAGTLIEPPRARRREVPRLTIGVHLAPGRQAGMP
ncbi:MAG: type II secretion system protein J [Vicinamibacterales bacterium]